MDKLDDAITRLESRTVVVADTDVPLRTGRPCHVAVPEDITADELLDLVTFLVGVMPAQLAEYRRRRGPQLIIPQ